MPDLAQTLADAKRLHQQGRPVPAEVLDRCNRDPDPDARHLLGVVAHHQGRDNRTAELIARTLAIRPD